MTVSRRDFIAAAAGTVVGAAIAGCGSKPRPACLGPSTGPGIAYCLVENGTVRIPGAAKLAVGEVTLMNVDDNTAAIVARDALGFYALSAICTHQCCLVSVCGDARCKVLRTNPGDCGVTPTTMLIGANGRAFVCACHGSEFHADGTVLSGPAVDPLPSVKMHFDGNDVVVDLSLPADPADRVIA